MHVQQTEIKERETIKAKKKGVQRRRNVRAERATPTYVGRWRPQVHTREQDPGAQKVVTWWKRPSSNGRSAGAYGVRGLVRGLASPPRRCSRRRPDSPRREHSATVPNIPQIGPPTWSLLDPWPRQDREQRRYRNDDKNDSRQKGIRMLIFLLLIINTIQLFMEPCHSKSFCQLDLVCAMQITHT